MRAIGNLVASTDIQPGTAVVIAPNYALTTFHCVKRRKNVEAVLHFYTLDQEVHEVRVRVSDGDDDTDLALLELCAPLPEGLEAVAIAEPAYLERIDFMIEGFGKDRPPGSGVHALDGHVVRTHASYGNAPALQLFSPQVAAREDPHGFSGAPVLVLALGGWVAVGIVRVARPLLEVSNDVSGQMIGGVVYATPVSEAAKLWPEVCKLVPTSFQAPTITDPNVAYRMVDEAAFAKQVRLWPGNKNVLEWVLRQLSRELENTVVLSPTVAHRMLEAAQRRPRS